MRLPDGGLLDAALSTDRFFGPLPPPDNRYTLYWRDGTRQVVEGETLGDAMANAGMAGGNPFRVLAVPGDDHGYIWDSERRDWLKKAAETAL